MSYPVEHYLAIEQMAPPEITGDTIVLTPRTDGKHNRGAQVNFLERTKFMPEQGKRYTNAGGGTFLCLRSEPNGEAVMQNVKSLWTFEAHGCGIYEDGTMDWDYSTGGHFERFEEV